MKACPNCKTECRNDSLFCYKCGFKFENDDIDDVNENGRDNVVFIDDVTDKNDNEKTVKMYCPSCGCYVDAVGNICPICWCYLGPEPITGRSAIEVYRERERASEDDGWKSNLGCLIYFILMFLCLVFCK